MSIYRKSSSLVVATAVVPAQAQLYVKALALFEPLYGLFGGDIKALDKTVCNAKTFAKGSHGRLCSLGKKDPEALADLIERCEDFRQILVELSLKKPKERNLKHCEDLVGRIQHANQKYLVFGQQERPYP